MRTRVGIIGAGVVGTAVGIVLAGKGYEITGVFDIKPESTQMLADRTGVRLGFLHRNRLQKRRTFCLLPSTMLQSGQLLIN